MKVFSKSRANETPTKENNFEYPVIIKNDEERSLAPSIVNDSYYKMVISNEQRKWISCYTLSLVFNLDYKFLLDNLFLYKNELDNVKYTKEKEKKSYSDFVAICDDMLFIIELNNTNTISRNLEYVYKLYAPTVKPRKTKEGEIIKGRYSYKKVYLINLNNFSFKNEEVIEEFKLKNNKDILLNEQNFVNISLPKIKKKVYYEGVRKLNRLERWLATLCEPSTSKAKKIAEGDEYCMAYIDERKVLLTVDDLRTAYDHEEAEKEAIKRQARASGIKIGESRGRASGIKIGRESGIEIGREKGHQEMKEHIIAQLKNSGISPDVIASLNSITL